MTETVEEQIRKRVMRMIEPSFSEDLWSNPDPFVHRNIPIGDFTPYLLIKILERLEAIETHLHSSGERTNHPTPPHEQLG